MARLSYYQFDLLELSKERIKWFEEKYPEFLRESLVRKNMNGKQMLIYDTYLFNKEIKRKLEIRLGSYR